MGRRGRGGYRTRAVAGGSVGAEKSRSASPSGSPAPTREAEWSASARKTMRWHSTTVRGVRIAVFTGSQAGPPSHQQAAAAFAAHLASADIGVVYGGGHVGLMGVVADAALAAGGEVVGVIPQHLVDDELAHPGLPRIEVVQTMHERKARMAELADAFVALPGAAGTLEELFEAWTWGILGLHAKPTALVDVDGF